MSQKARAALHKAWEAGTLDIELARGGLSIFEKQAILATTSDGRSAGRLPVGHRDDSHGRFSAESGDAGDEPRIIRWRPDEAVTPEEAAVINEIRRLGLNGVEGEEAYRTAGADLNLSPRQVRRRLESGNRKIRLRAGRVAEELLAGEEREAHDEASDEGSDE